MLSKVALAVLGALALALPTAANAAAAAAPTRTHVLEVRWTAAALWYESGTNVGNNFPGEGNNKTFAIGGRVGVDIVWREKIRLNGDQPPTEYGFTPTVLYSFARVVNEANVPGVSCEGTFSPALTTVYGTSKKVPLIYGGATEGFTYTLEPISIFRWLPTSPAGTICARNPGELDGYGCSDCSTAFSPDLPVPPYSPSANEATLREIGAPLIVNWKDPNQAKSYTWEQVGHWSTPEPGGASAATNHSLWLGCVSVQEDPPTNLPPPVDPFTLGGYRAGGVLQNPGALPLNPCSSHTSPGPPLTTTSAPAPSCQKPGTAKGIIQTAVRDDMNAELQVLVRRTDLFVGGSDVPTELPAATTDYEDAMLDDFAEHVDDPCMAAYLATWKFYGGIGSIGKSSQLVQSEASPPLATLFQLEQTFEKTGPRKPTITVDQAELGRLLRLSVPGSLTVTGTASLIGGGGMTLSLTGRVTPARAKPAIISVSFAGGPSAPSFVVHGNDLGTLPKPDPPGHPSGLNGCPVVADDTGYDYGTSLYLVGVSLNFSGGRYRPSHGETDCIDLVVTQFTESEISFHLGPFYLKFYKQFPLNDGEMVQFVVNGVQKVLHVKYGATVTS